MLDPKQSRSAISQHSMAFLLVTLVLFFAITPFLQDLPSGRYIDALLTSLFLIGALVAVAGRQRRLLIALLLGMAVLVGRWATLIWEGDQPNAFYIAVFSLFILLVVSQMLRFIVWAPSVTTEVLCAGIATYLLLGLLWAVAYTMVARLDPGSFAGVLATEQPLHGFQALYFSIGALTTAGSGDIIPLSGAARMLGMFESMTGPLFLAVLIARLVSLYSPSTSTGAPPKRELGPDNVPK
jgi:hypothetical protein